MNSNSDLYSQWRSPFTSRYATPEMLILLSEREKILTWRQLWIALAKAQHELGLPITEEQIKELEYCASNIDFERARLIESEIRHDVMAHIRLYAELCPIAAPIIHLGATSCFVVDNADLISIKKGCSLLSKRILKVVEILAEIAIKYHDMPILAYTHFQPAQLTTVGKRVCLWIQDLLIDFADLEYFLNNLCFRGVKGTTGTQASFLYLFNDDHNKVVQLDKRVTELMGFKSFFPITGQTYPRKIDAKLLSLLGGLAASASKFAVDIRLLSHEREIEEPFSKSQVGSSAMPYKKNPMRCERITSLCRILIDMISNPFHTAANQWLERTLDDSAGRRIVISEAFLLADSIINLYFNVAKGLQINSLVIDKNIQQELSYMATENILMAAVQAGGNRQDLHERIRNHALEVKNAINTEAAANNLINRIKSDIAFSSISNNIDSYLNINKMTGRSSKQTIDYITNNVSIFLNDHKAKLTDWDSDVNV